MTPSPSPPPSDRWLLVVLLIVCVLPRLAVLGRYWSDLSDDRDAYLGMAQGIAAGRGLSTPGSDRPTAFRPPLYPLLLAPWAGEHEQLPRAILHLLLATGTAWLIWRTAGHLGLSRSAKSLALLLFAFDPLLLRYLAFPMTETLCTFLSALLLFQVARPGPPTWVAAFLAGVTFGACVLARPTYWVFGVLFAVAHCFASWRAGRDTSLRISTEHVRGNLKRRAAALAGVAIVVLPWVIRNWIMIGTPIVMTTHGGYTLLLGNNTAFYEEVLNQPWGTIWDGSRGPGQEVWVDGINAQMDQQGLHSEVARNRWMGDLAKQTIREHPWTFLRACWWRFVRFWYVVPLGPEAAALPFWLRWGIAALYSLTWLLMLGGIARLAMSAFHVCRGERSVESSQQSDRFAPEFRGWLPLILLILSFVLVHLVYWSDARMRAPVMPAVVLLAAAALPRHRQESNHAPQPASFIAET